MPSFVFESDEELFMCGDITTTMISETKTPSKSSSNLCHNMDVAVKSIAAPSQKEKALAVTMLNREIKALSRCHHQNIVRLVGACLNPPQLVLAYASKGTFTTLKHYYQSTFFI